MAIALATQFKPYTDEIFKTEAKFSLVSNSDYDFTGAHAVKIYKIGTAALNDYARNVAADAASVPVSRYGVLADLSATTEEMLLSKDRSFIFNIDKADQDETQQQLEAASALARELREVVVPEIDTYVFAQMAANAGGQPTAATITKTNVYEKILAGSEALDAAEVPDTGRVLIVTPATYSLLKQSTVFDNADITAEQRMSGVVGMLDGMAVVKVPATRLPAKTAFIVAHPSATVVPVKLEDFNIHQDTPLSSGSVVTGRVIYDAFVLDNKANGIYIHKNA